MFIHNNDYKPVKNGSAFLHILFFMGVICFFSSCSSTKNSFYFKSLQRDTTIATFVDKDIELKVQKGDRLVIQVSSLSKEADDLYNSSSGVSGAASLSAIGTTSLSTAGVGNTTFTSPVEGPSGYPVDSIGNILIHTLGIVHVEGMTLKELSNKLQSSLQPYLKDPIVYVSFANHKVTILGNVERPQVLEMPAEPLTLLDALALSGGSSSQSNTSQRSILIIRDSLSNKKIKHIDLTDGAIFNSPWYYLKPNDIVYIEPDESKLDDEEKRIKTQQVLTIATSALTILVILLDRIK